MRKHDESDSHRPAAGGLPDLSLCAAGLDARLTLVEGGTDDVRVNLTLTKLGDKPVRLLKWQLPGSEKGIDQRHIAAVFQLQMLIGNAGGFNTSRIANNDFCAILTGFQHAPGSDGVRICAVVAKYQQAF